MRVGLVLGAGGVMGGAWLTGALAALAEETGWDPGTADRLVGTSAGSMMAALLAGGVPPWFMVAHSAGEVFEDVLDARGELASDADRAAGAVFRLAGVPRPVPGSLPLALSVLARPWKHAPGAWMAWLPAGCVSNRPLQDTVRRAVADEWPAHPGLRVVTCDYATGRRVVFGAPDAPPAALADAVAASCAIPGFYRPVRIGGRRYVDGGVWSASNLDLLRDEGLDLVVCLNPMSSRDGVGHGPARLMRAAAGRRLGLEARRLREAGTEVVLVQPTREDLAVMGDNLMATRRRHQVIETSLRTTRAQLREQASDLRGLRRSDSALVRRPTGPTSGWPAFRDLAAARFAA